MTLAEQAELGLRLVREHPLIAYDTETTGLNWKIHQPVGYVITADVQNNVYTIGGVDQMIAHRAILEGGDAGTARALVSALAQFAATKLS